MRPSAQQVPPAPGSSADAVDALKRRYEDKVAAAKGAQIKKYVDIAQTALAKKDFVAAANAYRVACTFEPEDAELKAAYEKAQVEADAVLCEQYLAQAKYEEKGEKWAEAARSWQRVARAPTVRAGGQP